MNTDEIIAMAKEAGIAEPTADGCLQFPWNEYVDLRPYLQHFAALVAEMAAARATEACAVLALDKAGTTDYDYSTCINIADAIRARGTKEGA